jgi:hypothetical protein
MAAPSRLQEIAEIDKRIEAIMSAKTQAIATELRKGNLGQTAQRAYEAQKRAA